MSEERQTTFDRLFSLLNKPVEEIEATRQRHHRESLSFTNFVKLLVYYFTQGIGSGRLLITIVRTVYVTRVGCVYAYQNESK